MVATGTKEGALIAMITVDSAVQKDLRTSLLIDFSLSHFTYSALPQHNPTTSPPSTSPIINPTIKIKDEPHSPQRDFQQHHSQQQQQQIHLTTPQLAHHLAGSRPSSNGSNCSNHSSNGLNNNSNNHLSPGQPLTPSTSSSPDPHCTDFDTPMHKRIRADKPQPTWSQM